MHRTQIMLEQWQYEALKAAAAQRSVSISELLREIVTRHLRPRRSKPNLEEIAGIGEDAGSLARDHDAFLYGKGRKRR